MTAVPAGAEPAPCDVCEALAAQRDAAREAGRAGEVVDCERELSEHGRHVRECAP
ncbi:hypothetical protein [Streptomyces geranii]|uniref:hypothetical protein n=1 Tax=Streptomyces geranii TaxID=2058923 RepID=UPI0013007E01|nr:hypothetical protein [Streptomyces geranii]